MKPLYHYVVIRKDLPLGVIAAQIIHAAGESSPGKLPKNTHAVALSARDEEELLSLEYDLIEANIPHKSIREPDAPYSNALMAIGFHPQSKERLKKFLSRFPLLR